MWNYLKLEILNLLFINQSLQRIKCSIFWALNINLLGSNKMLLSLSISFIIQTDTAQKMKFSIKDFFSKFDQIHSFLRIWLHLLKLYLMETSFFLQGDMISITALYGNSLMFFYKTQPAKRVLLLRVNDMYFQL